MAPFNSAQSSKLSDLYADPKTNVFRNKLGLQNKKQLEAVTAALVALRQQQLRDQRHPFLKHVGLSFESFKTVHHHLFQDVYEWAGQLREDKPEPTSRLELEERRERGPSLHPSWCVEFHAKQQTNEMERINNTHHSLSRESFLIASAEFMTHMYEVSPFPHGNKEAICAFIDNFGQKHNYAIAWEEIKPQDLENAFEECAYICDMSPAYETDWYIERKPKVFVSLFQDKIYQKDMKPLMDLIKSAHPDHEIVDYKHAQQGEEYHGPLIGATEDYVVQKQRDSLDEVILHKRSKLTPMPNFEDKNQSQVLSIRYPRGDIGLIQKEDDKTKSDEPTHKKNSFIRNLFFERDDHER